MRLQEERLGPKSKGVSCHQLLLYVALHNNSILGLCVCLCISHACEVEWEDVRTFVSCVWSGCVGLRSHLM